MKKLLSLILAVMLLLGCASALAEKQERILEGVTLTYWYPMWAWESEFVGAGDMDDLDFYKHLEEETGCHIEWILPPVDNNAAIAALNVLFASSDLPDIVTHPYYTYYPGGGDAAIADGFYIDLKPYLEEYAPDYWALLKEDEELLKQVTTDEGHIWCFYMIDSFAQPSYSGPVYRKDFIDAVGGKIPTTVDEMHDLLLKFQSELNLQYCIYNEPVNYLPFAYGVKNDFFMDEENKVQYGPMLDGWKEYLTTVHTWKEEGLLADDFVEPEKNSTAVVSGKVGNLYAGFNNMTEWTQLAQATEGTPESFELIAGPYLKVNEGDTLRFKAVHAYRAQQNCTAVTGACKNPEAAVMWLNQKFTQENILASNYGTEGVSYNMVDGKPQYTDEVAYPTEPGMTLGIYLYKFALGKGPYYRIMDRNWFTHLDSAIDAMYLWDGSTDGGTGDIPDSFLSMTPAEAEEFTAIMADITSFVAECRIKFITGEMSLEKDWDGYVSQIKSMDIEKAIALKQAALDRYLAR